MPAVAARNFDRQVHRFAAAHAEHGVGQGGRELRQLVRQRGALLADEMMVADVEFVQALDERLGDLRMAVPQVEDAAIAVAVDERLVALHIPQINAFAFARHKLDPRRLKNFTLLAETCAAK